MPCIEVNLHVFSESQSTMLNLNELSYSCWISWQESSALLVSQALEPNLFRKARCKRLKGAKSKARGSKNLVSITSRTSKRNTQTADSFWQVTEA